MKKFLKLLGVIPLATTMMLGLTGCFGGNDNNNNNNNNGTDEPPHQHEYSNVYEYDDTYHWHEPLCDDTTEISDKAEHVLIPQVLRQPNRYQEGVVVYSCRDCRYSTEHIDIPTVPHKYSTEWTCLADSHVHYCENCSDYTDETPHTYVNGKCSECGYTDGYRNFSGVHTYDSTGSYYVIRGIKDTTVENIVIPSHIGGSPVRKIDREAFKDNKNIKSITFSDSVEIIDFRAFYGCSNLTTVVFGKNIKQVGISAFNRCSALQSVKLPEGLETLGSSAFEGCNNLQEVELPTTLKKLESSTFDFCYNLVNLTLPDSLEQIENIFYNCNSLNYNEYSNGYYLGSKNNPYMVLVKQANNEIADITINSECKFIYYNALNGCANISSVVIPSKVTNIYAGALNNCENLTNLSVSEDNAVMCSENNIIYNKEKTVLLIAASNIDNVVVPDGVVEIGEKAFANSKLRYINLQDCTTLKTIGKNAFANSNIMNLVLNDGLVEIGEYAFYNCKNLTTIKIPVSVTTIKIIAFGGCDRLVEVRYSGTKEQWNEISISPLWLPDVEFTVSCTNGDIVYNKTEE